MIEYEYDGFGFRVFDEKGNDAYIQIDYDYCGLANTFGWQSCKCGFTDGTVDCKHKTASEMISSAFDYLIEHEGDKTEDSGYFTD